MKRMRILKLISVADIFTVINVLLGLGSIFATVSGWYHFAVNMILLGVVADGLDGVFARRFSKRWYLGDYLDLMSDTVTFCVAPSVLMFVLYFDPAHMDGFVGNLWDIDRAPLLVLAACGALVVTGVLRLARFCYQTFQLEDNFIGIPSPSAATTLSLLILLDLNLEASDIPEIPVAAIALVALLLSLLMISDITYLKLRGRIEWLAGALLILAIVLNYNTGIVAVVFLASVIYLVGGPLAVRKKKVGVPEGRGEKRTRSRDPGHTLRGGRSRVSEDE